MLSELSRKSIDNVLENAPNQGTLHMHEEPYMGKHDICSHEILQDKATEYKSKSSLSNKHTTKKVETEKHCDTDYLLFPWLAIVLFLL